MNKILLVSVAFIFGITLQAQNVIAINGIKGNSINFSNISYLLGEKIIDKNDISQQNPALLETMKNELQSPISPMIAAMAYDKANQTIVYMPMVSNQIYLYSLENKNLEAINAEKIFTISSCNEATFYSRMTIGNDGFVYAISNDGNTLLKINVKTKSVTNLGSLTNAEDLKERTKGFGGDMIADTQGNLYIISAMSNIYKININKKSFQFIGKINNLPENYATNGAAVMQDGKVLIGSATSNDLYVFDLATRNATLYQNYTTPIYDLASEYFLTDKAANQNATSLLLYPTKVENKTIHLQNATNAKATFLVYDLFSQQVLKSAITLQANQEQTISLKDLKQGIYIVKIISESGKELYNDKITIVK